VRRESKEVQAVRLREARRRGYGRADGGGLEPRGGRDLALRPRPVDPEQKPPPVDEAPEDHPRPRVSLRERLFEALELARRQTVDHALPRGARHLTGGRAADQASPPVSREASCPSPRRAAYTPR